MNKRNRLVTIGLVLLALVLFVYALYYEEHAIELFDGNTREQVGGGEYVNSIESELLMRRKADGKLYNAKSLKPSAAQIDDCPT